MGNSGSKTGRITPPRTRSTTKERGSRANSITHPLMFTAPGDRRRSSFSTLSRVSPSSTRGWRFRAPARSRARRLTTVSLNHHHQGNSDRAAFRVIHTRLGTRLLPSNFLFFFLSPSLASSHENSRYLARRFACHEPTVWLAVTSASRDFRACLPPKRDILIVRAKKFSKYLSTGGFINFSSWCLFFLAIA